MAGIGFELKKLINEQSLKGVMSAAFSGTFVVAGPWLVSTATLAAVERLPFFSQPGLAAEFNGAMIWALALSICLSAAPLYIFVRQSSDLVYKKEKRKAARLLVNFAGQMCIISLPAGFLLSLALTGAGPDALRLRLGFTFLFASANLLWISTSMGSVIRKRSRILLAYGLGIAIMIPLAGLLGSRWKAAGVLVALAAAYLAAALTLIWAIDEEFGGAQTYPGMKTEFRSYCIKYRHLALAGLLYSLATWADKAIPALRGGASAGFTHFFVNPDYDNAFYYSNLALIPGLVYFTIFTETDFELGLKHLLHSILKERQPEIRAASGQFYRETLHSITIQTGFQAAVALSLSLITGYLGPDLGFSAGLFARLLAASVFQLLLITSINLLFYLELYRDAAVAAGIFLGLNAGLCLLLGPAASSEPVCGWPYLISCFCSSLFACHFVLQGLRRFSRLFFLRASGEEYGE